MTRIGSGYIYLFILVACFFLPAMANKSQAAETHTDFNVRKDKEQKGNIFELVFGAAPPLATQRGILLIDAYDDKNNNGMRDGGEKSLDREIFCLIDDVEYDVPAFIPGLAYQGSYKVLCTGERYKPTIKREDLFIERRGQILRIDIPCRLVKDGAAHFQP